MKDNIEKSIKRWLKNKVKVTLGLIVSFLITGNIGYGNEILTPINITEENKIEININKENDIEINSNGDGYGVINIDNGENQNGYGNDEKLGYVNINTEGKFIIGDTNIENSIVKNGINVNTYAGTVDINTKDGVLINIKGDTLIGATESGHIKINSSGDIFLNAESNESILTMGYIRNLNNTYITFKKNGENILTGVNGIRKSNINVETTGDIIFIAKEMNENNYMNIGIFSAGIRKGAQRNDPVISGGNEKNDKYIDEDGYVMSEENITTLSGNKIDITILNKNGLANGILVQDSDKAFVNLSGVEEVSLIAMSDNSHSIGIDTAEGNIKFESLKGSNIIKAITNNSESLAIGIQTENNKLSGHWDNSDYYNRISLIARQNNTVFGTTTAIYSTGKDSIIDIKNTQGINTLQSERAETLSAEDGSEVYLTSQLGSNQVLAGQINSYGFGEQTAIKATTGSTVDLKSKVENRIAGTIYANGSGTKVKLNSNQNDSTSNIILSSAHGLESENQNHIVSAVYAQDKSNIVIDSGENGKNIIQTNFIFSDSNDNESERTIWAQQGGKVDINGQTTIIASNGKETEEIVTNSRGIALTAGSGENLDKYKNQDGTLKEIASKDRSTINLNYNKESGIKGDIVSGYGGLLNVIPKNSRDSLTIQGNILAGNQGIANVNLGNGGVWYGRADDYGDASSKHETFFNPAFSNEIIDSGEVNLTMGDNSTWYVQGQSWITNINTKNSQNTMIDLVNSNTDKNETAHALTINTLTGDTNFYMSLDGNRDVSDMLYIKNANGKYNISLDEAITEEDMFANGLSGLRFATVGTGSDVEFSVGTVEKGIFNVEYEVDTDSYKESEENHIYNGSDLTSEKPGDEAVDNFFKDKGMTTLAAIRNSSLTETTNFKIVGKNKETINDAGKTIIEMSKANYASAVYLDNLNKRLGDMTFAEGKEGFWVRLRNDRVGEDGEYRLHNYMTQLGYDKPYPMEEGKGTEYRGIAFEISKGDMDYKNINGDANVDRQALWLYDTNMYNNGFYSDYVFRAGRMESEFDIYGRETGVKVEGTYKNLFVGASAEYGYRYDLSEKTYLEPQVQLQYTYIDGTDYTTNQETKVELDEIHSVIGRAGARLGHDFYNKEGNKTATLYAKADINHEFLGDQRVKAKDKTGVIDKKYENDGTWYDIGIGASKDVTPDFNVYMDVERQIGRTRDDQSWQFNLGFRYRFNDVKDLNPVVMLRDFTMKADNYFDFDKSELKPEGKKVVKEISNELTKENATGTLKIEGHTDSIGTNEYNQKLSERRAQSVENEFKQNITTDKIKYETRGYGEERPIADNATKEGRAKNRRVEINFGGTIEN